MVGILSGETLGSFLKSAHFGVSRTIATVLLGLSPFLILHTISFHPGNLSKDFERNALLWVLYGSLRDPLTVSGGYAKHSLSLPLYPSWTCAL